jgi:glycosyltransferase involved in cell wall biosynthesis
MDIVIVRSNSVISDVRVSKISKSLSKKYQLLVLGWNREGLPGGTIGKYQNHLLFGMRAPFGSPILILLLPLFWCWIFFRLVQKRPKAVHACDLDVFIPCYFYKIVCRKKLVFDVFDKYAMAYIPPKYPTLYSAVDKLENNCAKKADVFITVSEKLLGAFPEFPKNHAIIMNCPDNIEASKERTNDDILTLVYTGAVVKNRGLERIMAAMDGLANVRLVIAGRVIDKDLLSQLLKSPNAKYEGVLRYADALLLEGASDAMVILYDLRLPINNYAMPNKLFEAMMLGLPVVSNVATEVINAVGCGITVDYDDVDEIRGAVVRLRDDPQLCSLLGTNGLKAFREKYNWSQMERELFRIYGGILGA